MKFFARFTVGATFALQSGGAADPYLPNLERSRKFYLQSFYNETAPAGFDDTWKMVATFGAAKADKWEAKAKALCRGGAALSRSLKGSER